MNFMIFKTIFHSKHRNLTLRINQKSKIRAIQMAVLYFPEISNR
jgi:hypothetical protein